MQIREIIWNLWSDDLIKVVADKAYIQIYSDAKQGNIVRKDGTVLSRFHVDNKTIYFAFAKKDNLTEFDYTTYGIALDADINEIRNIPHKDAIELYKVFDSFKKQ